MLHKSTKTGRDVPAEAQSDFRRLYERQCRIVKGSLALGQKLGIRVIAPSCQSTKQGSTDQRFVSSSHIVLFL